MGRRTTVLPLLIVTVLLFGFPAVQGHGAGSPPGYQMILHDCNDDYGGDAGLLNKGHDLVAMSLAEDTIDGQPLLLLHLTTNKQGTADTSKARETFSFKTPRAEISTTILSTKESGHQHVDGTEPAHLDGPLPAYRDDGETQDTGRAAYVIGYTYEQLQVQNDEQIELFQVVGEYDSGDGWTKGDHMAGGKYEDGEYVKTCDDDKSAPYTNVQSYTIQDSDWTPASQGDDEPGDGEDPGAALVADFTFTPRNPATGQNVTFTDASTGDPTSWNWDFGDDTTSDLQAPTHAYTDDGNYRVTLTVQDADGETATVSKNILVLNRRPVADFTWTPDTIRVGDVVQFESLAQDPDGEVASHRWDFGDDTTSSEDAPTHTYTNTGTYTVTLTATDQEGASHTATKTLTVAPSGGGSNTDETEGAPGPAVFGILLALGAALRIHCKR